MPRPTSDKPTLGLVLSHLGVMLAVSVVVGILVAALALPVTGGIGLSARTAANSVKQLPKMLQADPLPQRTRVLDRNGKQIAVLYDQNRVSVPLRKIAPVMRKALVDIEDSRFYQHGALDLQGTMRALVNNQTGGSVQGGSSITQQMAKMTAVQQAATPAQRAAATADSYERKFIELRHAIAFEQNYSKDWILNRYLNLAYFGDGAYGIEVASRHYFSKPASALTLAEAATLAGLVKNPVGYSPTQFPSEAIARRNTVLARMAELGTITKAQAEKISGQGLDLKVSDTNNGCLGSAAPFFCDYARRFLLADPQLGKTAADRQRLLQTGGLTIKTTLDRRYLSAANDAVRSAVAPTDQAIGAMAMVQPGTGQVLGIAQSRPMGRDPKKGQTFLDYVVPSRYGDANGFQAGSTFKVFVLAAALEQGLPTSTSYYSPPKLTVQQTDYKDCKGMYGINAPWEVNNSTTSGTMDMYTGTQQSVNTYYAQLEQDTGICQPFQLARDMGITLPYPNGTKDHAAQRVPSFVLGIADTDPLEMAGAYATFAARGKFCQPQPVMQILNAEGKVFKDYTPICRQVLKPETADTINQILSGVMSPGGFGADLMLNIPSAGKTGTIDSNMAVWFNGYTPALSTSAMIAGANQQGHWLSLNGQTLNGSYVYTAHGSTVAGPMWADAMRVIEDYLPNKSFGSGG